MMGVLVAVLTVGCGARPEESERPRYPYRVVTTVGMVADLVRETAGDRAEVVNLVGEGVDPHLYNPTRSDVAALMNADIIFYNGLMLEGKMGDVLIRAGRQGPPVYAVTDRIDALYLMESVDWEGQNDPHVWMDVQAWKQALDVVADALTEFDPDNADTYARNAEAYRGELAELDEYVKTAMATIPDDQRILITAHDAFNYFGRRYNVRVEGIQGLSTESEAGLQDINRLVDLLVEHEIGAVFIESSVADRNVRALVEGTQQRGHPVRIGGTLFSDAMGPHGSYEGTYIGMIDHNATTIVRALGGDAPEHGFQGRLEKDAKR